jgi:purine nucleosidase
MKRLIIDTDIGTDVDDALTLAYIYAKPRILDVVGIATTGGNTKLRADIAYTFLKACQVEDKSMPQFGVGYAQSLGGKVGYMSEVEATRYAVLQNPHISKDEVAIEDWYAKLLDKPTSILAIAALTNIASTLQKYPNLKTNIEHIYIMGGYTQDPSSNLCVPSMTSHNIKEDYDAAKIVFDAQIPITLLTKDIPLQFPYTLEEFNDAFLKKSGVHTLLYEHAEEMILKSKRNSVHLYDPILAMIAQNPDSATYKKQDNIAVITSINFNPKLVLETRLEAYIT